MPLYGPGVSKYKNFINTTDATTDKKKDIEKFFKEQATLDGNPSLSIKEADDSIRILKKTYQKQKDYSIEKIYWYFFLDFYNNLAEQISKKHNIDFKFSDAWSMLNFSKNYSLRQNLAKTKNYFNNIAKLASKYYYGKVRINIVNNYGIDFSFFNRSSDDYPATKIKKYDCPSCNKPFSLSYVKKQLRKIEGPGAHLYKKVLSKTPWRLRRQVHDIFLIYAISTENLSSRKLSLKAAEELVNDYFKNPARLTRNRLIYIRKNLFKGS